MACPVCGANDWTADGYIRFETEKEHLTYKHTKGDGFSGETVKWIRGKMCKNCGFIRGLQKGSYDVPE